MCLRFHKFHLLLIADEVHEITQVLHFQACLLTPVEEKWLILCASASETLGCLYSIHMMFYHIFSTVFILSMICSTIYFKLFVYYLLKFLDIFPVIHTYIGTLKMFHDMFYFSFTFDYYYFIAFFFIFFILFYVLRVFFHYCMRYIMIYFDLEYYSLEGGILFYLNGPIRFITVIIV